MLRYLAVADSGKIRISKFLKEGAGSEAEACGWSKILVFEFLCGGIVVKLICETKSAPDARAVYDRFVNAAFSRVYSVNSNVLQSHIQDIFKYHKIDGNERDSRFKFVKGNIIDYTENKCLEGICQYKEGSFKIEDHTDINKKIVLSMKTEDGHIQSVSLINILKFFGKCSIKIYECEKYIVVCEDAGDIFL
jgi:hypothetical protein